MPMACPAASQLDERVISEQRIHGVQEERDIVEVQISAPLLADRKELVADEIEVSHDDHVDRV